MNPSTRKRHPLDDQVHLDRLVGQPLPPDGDFTNLLPYTILHHLIMEFPKLSHDARDIMTTVLMQGRLDLCESYEAKEVSDDYEQVEHCLGLLRVLVQFAKETLERLDNVQNYFKQFE